MPISRDKHPKRNQGACTECRQVKLKCDSSERFPAPCTRCSRKNLHCRTDPNFKRTRTRNRLDEVTNQLDAIQKALAQQSQHHSPPLVQDDSTPGPCSGIESIIDNEELTFYQLLNTSDFPASPPMLGLASVDIEHVTQLFSHFETNYYRHCPILDTSASIEILYQSSPILFWTIIMLSSRWHPSLHHYYNTLLEPYRTLLGRTLAEQIFFLESIQALIILCFWPLSVPRQVEDPTWNYCGLVTHAARKMGLENVRISSTDRMARSKRKTWIAIVQVNCSQGWISGMTVSSDILKPLQLPPPGPSTSFEKQFFTKAKTWHMLAETSLIVTHFRRDIGSSLSFVQGLCANIEGLRDGAEDSWTAETDLVVIGAQLCIYALHIDQERKRSSEIKDTRLFGPDRDQAVSQRNTINMAYMTAARFIHRFTEMLSNSTITGIDDQAATVPQRYLPKNFFGLLLLSMAFVFKAKLLYATDPANLPSKPEEHISQVYQILTSWSRDRMDEASRAARVMRVILRADQQGDVKINESNPGDRPGVSFLDEVVKTAKDLRERQGIEAELPTGEAAIDGLYDSPTDSFTHDVSEIPLELMHDPSLEWNFPWGIDLLSGEQYNFDVNNIYSGMTQQH